MSTSFLREQHVDVQVAFDDLWNTIKRIPHVGVSVLSRAGRYWYANTAFKELFYDSENASLAGRTIDELEGDDVAAERCAVFERVCKSLEPVVFMHTRLGRRIESVISPWRFDQVEDAEVQFVIAVSVHTTSERAQSSQDAIESDYNSWGKLDALTERQLQVLAALRLGMSQKEVAKLLDVAVKTVETHRDSLVKRLQVRSTLEAIRLADEAALSLSNYDKARHAPLPWKDTLRDTA